MVTGEFAQDGHELKSIVTDDRMASGEAKKALIKEVKKIFTDRYNNPHRDNEKQPSVDFFF